MKQFLISAFAVAVLLLFGGVNEVSADPLTYKVSGNTVTVTDCKESASGALVIPATYDGKPVTSIGSWAFWKCTSLTSVTIPYSVTSIGNFTFHSCSDLTSVTIGNSVLNIMAGAFFRCSSLTSVTIPDSVTNIDIGAFVGCSSLTSIEVGKNNAEYSSEDEVLFSKNKTELIRFPAGKNGHYTIPDNVTSIADTAFYDCSRLTSVTIPDSVTTIGGGAFEGCGSLTSVTIPNSVTSIGGTAFYDCSRLASMTIPNSVTSIEDWTFFRCSSLKSVTIPDNVTSIGDYAFAGCGLRNVTIPDSVTSIDSYAFLGCFNLTSVTIPDSVTSISEGAFGRCSNLTSVTIPDSVTSIGYRAFGGCSSLTSVTIPDSVISIYDSAFEGCARLKRIIFGGDAPFFLGANVFRNVSGNARVFINPDAIAFGETFEGLPVIIQEKIEINTFSKSAAPFSLNFESKSGSTYIIEATQNLRQRVTWQWRWRKIGEVKGTGSSVKFTDWREAIFGNQYYRVKWVE